MKKISALILSFGLIISAAIPLAATISNTTAEAASNPRVVEIMVHGAFIPDKIEATEGEKLQLKFVRHDSGSCTKEVVFPSLGIRKELPTGETVTIDLPELKAGEVKFECGMGMIKGSIAVAAKR